MTLREEFEPHLAVGETTVTGRDIEMLRAIDRHGSMHGAAEALGRSYPHLQRRVVELEAAVGQLTRRARGSDGGGTRLMADAGGLIRRFERLRVELSGVTSAPESVLAGTVTGRDGELATVETAAGEVTARVPPEASAVEIAVRADAVVLMGPGSPSRGRTSLRDRIPGTADELALEERGATVTVVVADGVGIESLVTEASVDRLELEAGEDVVAAFKTAAARAVAVDS